MDNFLNFHHYCNLIKLQVEELFNRLSSNYLISSLIISISIFSIFMFFTTKVKSLPLDFDTFLEASSLSILIGYQFAGIKYLSTNIKPTFVKLEPLFKEDQFRTYFDYLDEKLIKSKMYYFVIILMVIPFILLEIIRFWRWKISIGPLPLYFSLFEPSNRWAIVLDIINHIFGYLMLFLLAIIVWRIANLIVIINELDRNPSINIDIFHIDEMGGLKPLRNFIVIIVSNYFIIITLAIISYISPRAIISYETIFLISLLFLGVIFFTITLKTIRNLINGSLKVELEKINEEYKKTHNKLIDIISKDKEFSKDELEKLSYTLEILEKEKIKIKERGRRKYDLNTIASFIGSFLIPMITLIEKIREFLPK